MSTVVITIDTDSKEITASIDGKEVGPQITSASVYCYESYYKKNEKELYWNVSVNNPTDESDFSSVTHYCSATASVSKTGRVDIVMNLPETLEGAKAGIKEEVVSRAKADIADYFEKRRNR